MKKILSIALIAALVLTSAFAGFKDTAATIDLGYDLDSEDYGFANATAIKYNFGFVLGAEDAAKAGEGDLKAEIAASFKAEFKAADYTKAGSMVSVSVGEDEDHEPVINLSGAPVISTLAITKANIIYKDILTFGILNAGKSADFASSYYDDDKDGKADVDKIVALEGVPGFTVKYDKIKGGFGLKGNSKTEDFAMLSYATVSGIALAEGVTADAAAAAKLSSTAGGDLKYTIQANGAASYAKDKISAKVAADFKIDEKAALEVAAKAGYDFVSADVYFYGIDNFDKVNLDAKLAAETKINDTVTKVGGSVEVRNVTEEERTITVAGKATVVVAPVTFDVEASYKNDDTATASAKATYKAEVFEAYAKLSFGMAFADEFKLTKIAPEVGVSSDKVINGAKVSLGWTGADFAEGVEKKGKIAAQVKIAL